VNINILISIDPSKIARFGALFIPEFGVDQLTKNLKIMDVLTPGYEFKDLQHGTAISVLFVKDEDINIKKAPAADTKKSAEVIDFKPSKKKRGKHDTRKVR